MNPLSFWEKQSFLNMPDVVIIGSGIVGINAALALKEMDARLNVTVVERGPLPSGASTKNAGFACFGSMTEILDDLETHSQKEVFALVERRWRGLQKLRSLVGDQKLHYQPLGGYEIFQKNETGRFESCLGHIAAFNQILEGITGQKKVYSVADEKIEGFGFNHTSHIIFNRIEGQLHTGEMMKSLLQLAQKKGVQLLNGLDISQVHEAENHVDILASNGWHFSARKVLVTTNGFARQFFPTLELWPARNQVLITKPVKNLPFRGAFHHDRGYVYFRNVDVPGSKTQSRILLGGRRNLAPDQENTEEFGTTAVIQNALENLLSEIVLPRQKVEIESWWSGIMGLGNTKKPIVEMVSPNVGVAVRLGGMGVALGSLVGKEAANMVFQQ